MREIARELGMVPGALYYYFERKEDLLEHRHFQENDRQGKLDAEACGSPLEPHLPPVLADDPGEKAEDNESGKALQEHGRCCTPPLCGLSRRAGA